MRFIQQRHILFLSCVLALALFGSMASAAHAALGKGYAIDDYECYENEEDPSLLECLHAKGVAKITTTPSGQSNFINNFLYTFSIIDADGVVVYQDSMKVNWHSLTKDDLLKEMSLHARFSYETCTRNYMFHEVDGQLQFYRDQSTCPVE